MLIELDITNPFPSKSCYEFLDMSRLAGDREMEVKLSFRCYSLEKL